MWYSVVCTIAWLDTKIHASSDRQLLKTSSLLTKLYCSGISEVIMKIPTMNKKQFEKYLTIIDHPTQLSPSPDTATLFMIYRKHITRFPYQNYDLYNGAEVANLEIDPNLEYM